MSIRASLSALLLLLSGCGNFFENKGGSSLNRQASKEAGIFFADIRVTVLEPYCIKCHGAYKDYAVVKQDLAAMVNAVDSNRMPKGGSPLEASLKDLLHAWLANGAPEKADSIETPIGEDNGLKPNWESLYAHIFAPRCTVCHSATGEAPWVDLSDRPNMLKTLLNHIDLNNPETSYLVKRLQDQAEPMPPKDSPFRQLNQEEVSVVIEWIRLGLP